jgi:hypothetical protein
MACAAACNASRCAALRGSRATTSPPRVRTVSARTLTPATRPWGAGRSAASSTIADRAKTLVLRTA